MSFCTDKLQVLKAVAVVAVDAAFLCIYYIQKTFFGNIVESVGVKRINRILRFHYAEPTRHFWSVFPLQDSTAFRVPGALASNFSST